MLKLQITKLKILVAEGKGLRTLNGIFVPQNIQQ